MEENREGKSREQEEGRDSRDFLRMDQFGENWVDFSEKELKEEMERAETSLNDGEFEGVEDRIYRRLMERIAAAEQSKTSNERRGDGEKKVVLEVARLEEKRAETEQRKASERKERENQYEKEQMESQEQAVIRKPKRKRKRRFLAVGVIAAAFVMMLGVTAIGGKNYFYRMTEQKGGKIVFDNDQSRMEVSTLEEAYAKIEEQFEGTVLKLGYVPQEMEIEKLNISNTAAVITFKYKGKRIHYIQYVGDSGYDSGYSIGMKSDRSDGENMETVYNAWIQEDMLIQKDILEDGSIEYGVQFAKKNCIYGLSGVMEIDEFKKIVEKMYFFD